MTDKKTTAVLAFTLLVITILAPTFSSAGTTPAVNWSQVTTANAPSPRGYPSMAFDSVSKKVVLFGGFDGAYLNDTWTFDGTNWTKVATGVAPPVRTAATMAFDRVSRKIVLFGGYNGSNYLGDTWLWDGSTSTWTQASPTISPKPVTGPMVFTDPVNGRVDEYGGFDGNFYELTMYQWNGTSWKHLNPATVPFARSSAAVGTDPVRKSTVLFAGLGDVNPYNTWTWDGSNWTLQSPPTQPPGTRYGSAAAYDSHLQRVLVFGGAEGGIPLNDTWAWTGINWVQLVPTNSPPAREGFGMAYDGALKMIVVFGGQAGSSFLGDTWELMP